MKQCFIKHVDKNIIDAWTGIGWEDWHRFQRIGKTIKLIKGKPVTPEQFKEIKNVLFNGKNG